MVKLYTLAVLAILTTGMSYGQDFVYIGGPQHRVDTVLNENYESYQIAMITSSPENITFGWELISNTFHPLWSTAVCDYTSCYVGFPGSATMAPLSAVDMAAGSSGFIKCNITCGLNYGTGTVEVYVFDQNNYSRGDTVSFTIHWPAPATGVEENVMSISAYPNPVLDQLTIQNNSALTGNVAVTDILGKSVYTNRINAGETRMINFSSMVNGVYLVKLTSDDGSTVTKKVIKK
ncbi:MAG: T9SS type A sorting domain-containing protein [Flavobacteriales bacterium]|nr:T9SS type A sorting domain-containing protein [Flavobacteriales bacterium]